jgi:iron complex outermembrane receptor protein
MLDRRIALMGFASFVALTAATPAVAQDPDEAVLEEIIVTVQKREQSIQDVPAAITAVSGDQLERLGIEEMSDLAAFVPGLEIQNQSPNNPGFVIRGVTSDSLEATNEPRVSVFQDGVSISRATGSYVELFDLRRVEVAKGPQSTLFGRGALIGAVNLIQNRADLTGFEGMARVSGGDLGYFMAEGFANVPLSDTFGVRLAGRVRQRDGYVDNVLGGEDFNSIDTAAIRLLARWRPTDRLTADVIFNWQQDTPSATAFKSINFLPNDPITGVILAGQGASEGAALAVPAGFQRGLGTNREVWGYTGLVEYDISDTLSLSSITAYRRFEAIEVGDSDGISPNILAFQRSTDGDQWSQELRLAYDDGGAISWFVGANYFREEGVDQSLVSFDERYALGVLTGQLNAAAAGSGLPSNVPAPDAFFSNSAFTGALVQGLVAALSNGNVILPGPVAQGIAANLSSQHLEQGTNGASLTAWDLFGDVTFRPTDRLELGAGIRYTSDEKDTSFDSSVLAGRSVLGGLVGVSPLAASGDPAAIAQVNALLTALAAPGARTIPPSLLYPVPLFGLTFQPTANNGDVVTQSLADEGFTWRLTALFRATDDLNLFANYARGRRPEVLSVGAPAQPFAAPRFNVVEAETVDSFEVGAKWTAPTTGLMLDGAVFYFAYDNFQTVEQVGTQFITTNAGEATAYGFEGQVTWSPTSMVDVYGTYAYNNAQFDSGAYEGNRFRLSPEHSASIGASFRFAVAGGELDFRPTYTWQSEIFFDDNNDRADLQLPPRVFVADTAVDEIQEGYGLLNLRLSYSRDDAPWSIEVFADNVLDEEYIIDAGNTGDALGLPTYIAGPPATYGVTLTVRSW